MQLYASVNVEIPNGVKEKATKCLFDYRCDTTGRCGFQDSCKVESLIDQSMAWISAPPRLPCPYYVAFGDGHICACPARINLHSASEEGRDYQR